MHGLLYWEVGKYYLRNISAERASHLVWKLFLEILFLDHKYLVFLRIFISFKNRGYTGYTTSPPPFADFVWVEIIGPILGVLPPLYGLNATNRNGPSP